MNLSNETELSAGQQRSRSSSPITLNGLCNKDNVQRILVIKLRHFGDVLLTTPLLNTLKIHFPHALIDVLVYSGTQDILSANKTVNQAWTVMRGSKYTSVKAQICSEWALFNNLKQQGYDLILNLSDQWRAGLYCRLLQPKFSIAFHYSKRDNWLWRYCHSKLVYISNSTEQHTVLTNLAILEPLQLTDVNTEVTMAYSMADVERITQICQQWKLDNYILIQPGSRWKFKTWSSASFSLLIDHLIMQGKMVVLTGGNDKAALDHIADIVNGCAKKNGSQNSKLINLAGTLTFPELAVLIDRACLYIGVDSVAMHMAAALHTPSVVLFGPTNLKQWYPWQARHTLLWAGDYRPLPSSDEVDTNTTERYLDAIPVQDVIKAIDSECS
ncbi:putative lipopolysaccharide heptosyltransferase III [Candidatus Fukatsuia symbiotica]|uniref:Lipopolysaccharide heptosyltransferase 3 n=1 Tax=Candidatus Fukatsuia symbiotica TaxID=1878942 RepID=A0A2U8I6B2_9GAMM|nr:putative lipopolysaccharide heptosyltransferase III [Candidatus Fukatsuia symbiotica]AWK14721.1 putative lipopolysaccharide heptosyltransferase III [Candidatus Fukatsuia symbiotica]MEA9445050.1 putative lipopolysaccharide heptosyltransferase III [Candidatus Fukatsuia symbiotica]